MFQRVMYGTIKNEENKKLRDLNAREFAYLVPLVVLMFVMGFWPKLVLDRMEPSIRATLSRVALRVQDSRHNVPQFMELYEHPYTEARR
jgi:NADH-quinone oxidoreductase subunit M